MSERCNIDKCEQNSHVLCYCCKKNLCLDHLANHRTLLDFQSFSIADQTNILNEQLKKLDNQTLVENTRQKLDKWRDESLKKVQRFYEQKCEDLERYFNENIQKKQLEFTQLHRKLTESNQISNDNETIKEFLFTNKQKIDSIEQHGIPITIQPLVIKNNLITIGDMKKIDDEFDLTVLSTSTTQTIDCSSQFGSSLSTNDQYILIDQNPRLTLVDFQLNVVEQISWNYGIISDMCWSSLLDSFVLITEKSKAYLVNAKSLAVRLIESMQNQLWISCSCDQSSLFVSSLSNGIVEFTLLPSISYLKRWDPPMTCQNDQSIKDICLNETSIAFLVFSNTNQTVDFLIRSISTFHQLFSVRLQISNPSYSLPIRCCSHKNKKQWLISDANSSQLLLIDQYGKMKSTFSYDQPPLNLVVCNSNLLVIRTEQMIHLYRLENWS